VPDPRGATRRRPYQSSAEHAVGAVLAQVQHQQPRHAQQLQWDSSVQRVPREVEKAQHVQAVQRPRRDGASKAYVGEV
jgi:hypothetical protein